MDALKFVGIQSKFVALCYNLQLFPDSNDYSYANGFQVLYLHALHEGTYQINEIFSINVYVGSKMCPPTTDIIHLRIPTGKLGDFSLSRVR
jgi:hypothetical protein